MDSALERFLIAAEKDKSNREGIFIVEAAVGQRKSRRFDIWAGKYGAPDAQVHRVIGLRLEGMEEMGWVPCVRDIEEDDWPLETTYYDVVIMEKLVAYDDKDVHGY